MHALLLLLPLLLLGEIATAVSCGVPIVPVACDDYAAPDDQALAQLNSVWTKEQAHTLATYGIEFVNIEDAYRHLRGLPLGEAHDVDRRAIRLEQLLDRLLERRLPILELEGHGALVGVDVGDVAPRVGGQPLRDHRDVAEGRRHQQEV